MKSLLTLLLLFWISNLNAQNYVEMYSDFIPVDTINSNSTLSNTFNKNIEVLGKINPDLIYFYIKYMDLLLTKNIVDSDSNYKNILDAYRNHFRFENNKFLLKNLNDLEIKDNSFLIKQKMKNILHSNLSSREKELVEVPKIKIDENLRDYFAFLYLTNSINIKYESHTDYRNRCNNATTSISNNYKKYIEQLINNNSDPDFDVLNEVFYHLYLFNEKYDYKYYSKNNLELLIFLENFVNVQVKIWDQIEFQYSYDIIPYQFQSTFTIHEMVAKDTDVKLEPNLNSLMNFTVALQQKRLTEYGPFSYIKYKLGFVYIPQKIEEKIITGNIAALQGIGRFGGPYGFKETFNNYFSISAQLAIPVFYVGKNIIFEAGIDYTFQSISYEFEFTRDADWLLNPNQYPQYALPPDKENHSLNKTNHQLTPVISVIYSLSRIIDLRSDLPILSISSNSEFHSWIKWRYSIVYKIRI